MAARRVAQAGLGHCMAARRVVAAARRAGTVHSADWASGLQTDSYCAKAADDVATLQELATVQKRVVSKKILNENCENMQLACGVLPVIAA
jgi:hypothetical protein